jgi:hypothetical protein
MNRQFETPGNGHENTAPRRAVQLGHHETGDPGDPGECLGLRNGILAGRRIKHQ